VWTVQYHPEFTAALLPQIEADFGWPANSSDRDFDGVSVERTLANFVGLSAE
jgi:GMP synthase (glutamine-hydrolysing)